MLHRQYYIAILASFVLLVTMYFGCDRVPKNHKSKANTSEHADAKEEGINGLIEAAKAKLAPEMSANVSTLEQQIKMSASDTAKSNLMKQLSSIWYRQDKKTIAGYFANEIATIDKTERAWLIAGSTLFESIKENEDAELRNYCTDNAAKAFDNAIALAPENVQYQISRALCFTENPPQDNPMKGILMLRDLDTKYPENAQVLFQLAKLAMRTNQYDKAVTRLEQILKKTPNNPDAICLLSDAYRGKGDAAKADKLAKQCTGFFKK